MDLSIVIPTRDRRESLLATLDALDAQKLGGVQAEAVIVVDGSRDGTAEAVRSLASSLPVRLVEQDTAGASAARNRALAEATGDVVMFIDDDTRPATQDLLAVHARLHRETPDPLYGVVGRVDRPPDVRLSEFERWLARSGFEYMQPGRPAGPVGPAAHFYTSHVSVKVSMVRELGGFDESLPYLLDDTELGIRMERAGGRLDFRPELVVHHYHPPRELRAFARRMEASGVAARAVTDKWGDSVPAAVTRPNAKWPLYRPAALLGELIVRAPTARALRERAWTAILMASYVRGYRRGADSLRR